jgi:nucleoid-associated protein YgaU
LSRFRRGAVVALVAVLFAVGAWSVAAQEAGAGDESKQKTEPNSLVRRLKQAQEAKRQRELVEMRQHRAEIERRQRNAERKREIDSILGDAARDPSFDTTEKRSAETDQAEPKSLFERLFSFSSGKPEAKPEPPKPSDRPVRKHTIAEGETFSKLAIKYYNDKNKWTVIGQANPGVDPTRLKIGQVIRVPALEQHASERRDNVERLEAAKAEQPKPTAEAPAATRKITTEEGDTLGEISDRVYGTSRRWNDIYEANKGLLKSPDRVPVGVVLVIPE